MKRGYWGAVDGSLDGSKLASYLIYPLIIDEAPFNYLFNIYLIFPLTFRLFHRSIVNNFNIFLFSFF